MSNIKVTIHPSKLEIFSQEKSNLMDVLVSAGIIIQNHCGGHGVCKKCLIKLIEGELSPDSKYGEYYLACKAEILSDIVIEPVELREKSNITEFYNFKAEKLNSGLKRINLELIPPTKEDKTSDLDRINLVMPDYSVSDIKLIQKLPFILRENDWKTSAIVDESKKEIVDITNRDKTQILGLAIDIGTTTVNSVLTDLNTGKVIDSESSYNQQITYGADVISRMIFAEKENGLEKLHTAIVKNINELIDIIAVRNNIDNTDIYSVVIAGNTTMIHLLTKVPPKYIRMEPYIPAFSKFKLKAGDIDIYVNKNAPVYCFPSIGSYVGGDIISGILASNMWQDNKIKLFIDIGTNGEMVLGNDEWLLACACSAGPAFEGGRGKMWHKGCRWCYRENLH